MLLLLLQIELQPLTNGVGIDIGQSTPVGKAIIIAADPFNGLPFEQTVVFPGGFLDAVKIKHSFVPGLTQNRNRQVFLGPEI